MQASMLPGRNGTRSAPSGEGSVRPDSEEVGRNRSLKHVKGSMMSFKKVSGLGWRGVGRWRQEFTFWKDTCVCKFRKGMGCSRFINSSPNQCPP